MSKKKINIDKKESVLEYNGTVYNQRYIYYYDNGNINFISVKIENIDLPYIIIDDFLISDFIEGKKNYKNYNIEYFNNLKKGLDVSLEKVNNNTNIKYYVLPIVDNYDNEIIVEHLNDRWHLKIKNIHEITSEIIVYVCFKHNLNFLIRTLKFNKNNNYIQYFYTDEEKKIKNLCLISKTKYKINILKNYYD